MTSDAALLVLIVDDERALAILAAWGALALKLDQIDQCVSLVVEVTGLSRDAVIRGLAKLKAARVLVDGGISELADKLLQSKVQQSLDGGKRKKR